MLPGKLPDNSFQKRCLALVPSVVLRLSLPSAASLCCDPEALAAYEAKHWGLLAPDDAQSKVLFAWSIRRR